MADDDLGSYITATVHKALSGAPASGLWITADGAETPSPADWTKEYESTGSSNVGDRVTATVRNPVRPIVTGNAIQGRAS